MSSQYKLPLLKSDLQALMVLLTMVFAFGNAQAQTVGQIQLVIGKNAELNRGGILSRVNSQMPLQQGDVLVTGKQSHIHIKFEDGAIAALRPNSTLKIECYQTNPVQPLCMKLNLVEGTVRKISGPASQAHKESFRLNTPVAAIGVRGTDFITQISPAGETFVQVVEGAITASPFVENCTPQGLGNCETSMTALLTENDTFMLRISAGSQPEMQAINQQLSEIEFKNSKMYSNHNHTNNTLQVLKDDPALIDRYLEEAAQNAVNLPNVAIENSNQQLVFGSWNLSSPGIAMPYEQAKQNREVTVGNQYLALWRENGQYQPAVGKVDYTLTDSSAFLVQPDSIESAQVTEGELSIDFDASKLQTSITITPDSFSKNYIFSATQNISREDGIFAIHTEDGRIAAGAISNDASQVGYMLQQSVNEGEIHVQTLWQAQ